MDKSIGKDPWKYQIKEIKKEEDQSKLSIAIKRTKSSKVCGWFRNIEGDFKNENYFTFTKMKVFTIFVKF